MKRAVINWIKRATFNGATIWRQDVIDFMERNYPSMSEARVQLMTARAVAGCPDHLRWSLT